MKRKAIPALIAMVLMIVIAAAAIGVWYQNKYSYSMEEMDLAEYYHAEDGRPAVYIKEKRLEEKALIKDGVWYVDTDFIKKYLGDIFYVDKELDQLICTDAAGSIVSRIGTNEYSLYGEVKSRPETISFWQDGALWISLSYAQLFLDFEYETYDHRMKLIWEWEPYAAVPVVKDTWVRYRGGIKSDILRPISEGEKVVVLEVLENWSKVLTDDCVIGYVENKRLGVEETVTPVKKTRSSEYTAPEYTTVRLPEKVCLGWHAIGAVGGNVTLEEMVRGSVGMNVIAPTWFSLNDNEGGFRDFGETSYVERAHSYGLQVWGVWDDFNYENETKEKIDDTLILSTAAIRERLVRGIMDKALEYGLDGINIDFEKLGGDAGEAYAQFLRELSVECRKNGICLSVDNYMPNEGNKQYRLGVQGLVTDYVILMGYDEHWHGSSDPGSVASIGFVTEGITRTLQYVSPDKLVNAVPFYTILWKLEGGVVEDEYLTMVNQPEFLEKVGVTTVWDAVACQNYAEWTSGAKTYKIWFEDLESLNVKLNVMRANDLAGVAAWRLGYGTQEAWNLLSTFRNM